MDDDNRINVITITTPARIHRNIDTFLLQDVVFFFEDRRMVVVVVLDDDDASTNGGNETVVSYSFIVMEIIIVSER